MSEDQSAAAARSDQRAMSEDQSAAAARSDQRGMSEDQSAAAQATSVSVDLAVPGAALAVGAHPDDVEFGCGGTLAKWAAAGCRIFHLVCTDGSKGSWDPADDTALLVAQRQEEQRAASLALGGGGDVVFCGWTDGELEAGLGQRAEVAAWIRRLRPDVVLGHDPWKRYRLHPDHRAAGFLLTDAIVAARDPHFLPEVDEPPHRPSVLLLWEADEPDHVEDIGDHLATKLSAILCHRSQYRSTMDIDDPASAEQLDRFRARIAQRAAEHGRPAGIARGERFKAVRPL
jgi:LmbE family N-acetylglucosaminyl deacetylase